MTDAAENKAGAEMLRFHTLLCDTKDPSIRNIVAITMIFGMLSKQCNLLEEIRDRMPARSAT